MLFRSLIHVAGFLSLCLFFGIQDAKAQIIITRDDFRPSDVEVTVDSVFTWAGSSGVLRRLVRAVGADQVYRLDDFAYEAGTRAEEHKNTLAIPGTHEPSFATANYVQYAKENGGTASAFFTLNEEGYFFNGLFLEGDFNQDGAVDSVTTVNDPLTLVIPFPLAMGQTWSTTFIETTRTLGISLSTTIREEARVDAWGTLVTPAGEEPCLRILRSRTVTFPDGMGQTVQQINFITKGRLGATIFFNGTRPAGVTYTVDYTPAMATSRESSLSEIPQAVDLAPNFPNPFRTSTTIPFEVKEVSEVILSVYNTLGQEVEKLVHRWMGPGKYSVDFYATHQPAGVYLYKLRANRQEVVRSMVVQR